MTLIPSHRDAQAIGHRVLTVIASGKADGIQDLASLPPSRRPVALLKFFRQLIPILDPHPLLRLRVQACLGCFGKTRS